MFKMKCVACVLLSLLFVGIAAGVDARPASAQRRLSVVLFPTENYTDIQIWESRFFPYSVLERRMTEYLAALFNNSPTVDVTILDENGMNRWLNQPHRMEDMAVQMELHGAVLKERNVLGRMETGQVRLRVRIYDASAEQFATRIATGRDRRYTFEPGEDGLFWLNATVTSLPVPFRGGLDLLGLTGSRYRGPRMSRPTWQQVSGTSHWQAIKNAVKDAHEEAMAHVSRALRRNEPDAYVLGVAPFSPFATNVGRIISPTADSTRRSRRFIISKGREAALRIGDILEVVRSDTYVTVDPENPIAVIPNTVGRVRVIDLQERTAVVQVIQDNRREPIQLMDLVMKFH